MCVAHIGLYDHYANIAKKEENFDVCFESPCRYGNLRRKIQCEFWTSMHVLQRKKDLVCVLSPHGIAIEKEKSNMCFANNMPVLHTLYLSNGK
jgi:hypothetical protein